MAFLFYNDWAREPASQNRLGKINPYIAQMVFVLVHIAVIVYPCHYRIFYIPLGSREKLQHPALVLKATQVIYNYRNIAATLGLCNRFLQLNACGIKFSKNFYSSHLSVFLPSMSCCPLYLPRITDGRISLPSGLKGSGRNFLFALLRIHFQRKTLRKK